MDFSLSVHVLELTLLVLFWGALLVLAIWLLGLLFPVAKPPKHDRTNSVKR
jgi:hypothetical protein